MADQVAHVSGLQPSGRMAGILTSIGRIAARTPNVQYNDRLMNSCRRSRRWHPPGDVERWRWGRVESVRWQVGNKGTVGDRRGHDKYLAPVFTLQFARFVSWDSIGFSARVGRRQHESSNPADHTGPPEQVGGTDDGEVRSVLHKGERLCRRTVYRRSRLSFLPFRKPLRL